VNLGIIQACKQKRTGPHLYGRPNSDRHVSKVEVTTQTFP